MFRALRFAIVGAIMALAAALVTILQLTGAAFADGGTLRQAPPPAWVDYLPDITALSGARSDEAEAKRYLLRDMQFTWEEGGREIWERHVIEIATPTGVTAAATQVFGYNSALEDFTLTGASVWRAGEEIALRDTPQMLVEVFGTSYEEGPVDPQVFVLMSFPDLRPGDVLDLSFLRRALADLDGPSRELQQEAVALLQFDEPVTLARAVVNWPAGREMFFPALPSEITLATGPLAGGGTRYDFQLFDFTAPPGEEMVPSWVDERAMLRARADRDWGRIATTLAQHYAADWPLGPWEARVDALRPADGVITTGEIAKALFLVQDEVEDRAAPGPTGKGLMTPPAEVALRGLGSPAEKALLLRTVLRRLGVEADVALTSFDYGRALDRLPPSMEFLTTALVRVQLNGETWWLDPAGPPQAARLEAMSPPDYGFALPLVPGVTQPVVMEAAPAAIWTSDVHETWRFTPAGLFLDVISEHRGESADDLRYRYTELGIEDISSELHGYYQITFPSMTMIREPDLTDDPENNILRLHERYFLPASVIREQGLLAAFPVSSENFTADLPEGGAGYLRATGRKSPMIGLSAGYYRHRTELWGRFGLLVPPVAVELDNPAFSYRLKGEAPGPGRLLVEWEFTAASTDISLSDLPKVLTDAKTVYDTTWFQYDLE